MTAADAPNTRCGFVALLGAPNAGKSTLLNCLVGEKISIVTAKPQTTRMCIRGIAIEGPAQMVFVDTPGIFVQPKRRLERAMVAAAWSGAADADVKLLLVDAVKGRRRDVGRIVDGFRAAGAKAVLVLNKIDKADRPRLLGLVAEFNETGCFTDTFMISALTGDGVTDLRTHLARHMPAGPWLFPEDQIADLPQRLLAADVTREKAFMLLSDELPYALTVETDTWENFANGSVRIDQIIFVEREAQKPIVLGKGGAKIKRIRTLAQEDLQEQLGRPVHLFLFVKVRAKWVDDPERYREMGLDYRA